MNNSKKYNDGFTLIEIMVTVAIVGVFASIALPNFARLIENNRISTFTNELVTNVLLTKSEALKRSSSVTMCASRDQVTCSGTRDFNEGWIIFLDCNDEGEMDAGAIVGCGPNNREEVIKVGEGSPSLYAQNRTRDAITYRFTGRPAGVSTFDVGPDSSNLKKEITINLVGRVRASDH